MKFVDARAEQHVRTARQRDTKAVELGDISGHSFGMRVDARDVDAAPSLSASSPALVSPTKLTRASGPRRKIGAVRFSPSARNLRGDSPVASG